MSFLEKVQATYHSAVPYHNDLHGADVMHMCYYFMSTGRLVETIKMDGLDQLAMIIAAVCHDLGHDGLNNGFHVNNITKRAIDSNDLSIQEHFHASELFRLLQANESNFLEGLTRVEFMQFRKRVLSCILATDMAKHNAKISSMQQIVKTNKFENV